MNKLFNFTAFSIPKDKLEEKDKIIEDLMKEIDNLKLEKTCNICYEPSKTKCLNCTFQYCTECIRKLTSQYSYHKGIQTFYYNCSMCRKHSSFSHIPESFTPPPTARTSNRAYISTPEGLPPQAPVQAPRELPVQFQRCTRTTRQGTRCTRNTGHASGLCGQHLLMQSQGR